MAMTIEMLELDEELELITKAYSAHQCEFPAVTLYTARNSDNAYMYFNKMAAPLVPKKIVWYVSSSYVIGLPAKDGDTVSFITRCSNKYGIGKMARFPSLMKKEKGVGTGVYRVYKYKDGLAFKRYEPEWRI